MEKKTLQQLSQNQPFPHLYLIGSTHQIFQKKRNKRYKFPGWSASFCITSTFLFRTQNCSLLAQLWSKGSQAQSFFYHGYATLHARSLKKCFISKGSPPLRKVQFFWTLFKRGGGGGVNPCSKIMSEIVVCSGGHLTTWNLQGFNNMKFARIFYRGLP